MRPLPAAARVSPSRLGSSPTVEILYSAIPFFGEPDVKTKKPLRANPGSVFQLLESLQAGPDLWYRVSSPKGPLWLVGRSGEYVYAEESSKLPQIKDQEMTGNGWTAFRKEASREAAARGDLETVSVPLIRGNQQIFVARGTGPAFAELLQWWDQNVQPVNTVGSYNYRRMASDSSKLSLHSSGTAIDINGCWRDAGGRLSDGCTLPYREKTIQDEGLRARIREKAAELGLKWGGDWSSKNIDEMHFEVTSDPVAFRAFWAKRSSTPPVMAPVPEAAKTIDALTSLLPGQQRGALPPTQRAREMEEYAKFFIPLGAAVAVGALFLLRSSASSSSTRYR